MAAKLALLDASVGETPARRNFRRAFEAEVTAFEASEGELPAVSAVDGFAGWPYDGVVISGSQTSVYWDEPWIADVRGWVADAVERGVPVLGVCWGHQLLATATGGTVADAGAYELGYREIDRVADAPIFEGVPERFVAFESHSDDVTGLPEGATLLAENDRAIQSFRVRNAFGVQFHPEYDRETAAWVTENKRGELADERVEELLATVTESRHAETEPAKRVFANFERFAAEASLRAPADG
ncbi:MAG: type 1 glutamine amidotransferase [Haloarculaceae archaeon]